MRSQLGSFEARDLKVPDVERPVRGSGYGAAVCVAAWGVPTVMAEQPGGRESAPPVALHAAPLAAL